jgi:hypothetical protein
MNDITFSKLFSSVMLDNKFDRFVKNRRTGKLDTKGLYKVDTSSRLFKKREARKNKNYAVSLVVDVSGSMRGEKLNTASESAKKLSFHLSKIGINHNVVVFASHVEEVKPFGIKFDDQIDHRILGQMGYGKLSENYDTYIHWIKGTGQRVVSKKTGATLIPFVCLTKGIEKSVKN